LIGTSSPMAHAHARARAHAHARARAQAHAHARAHAHAHAHTTYIPLHLVAYDHVLLVEHDVHQLLVG